MLCYVILCNIVRRRVKRATLAVVVGPVPRGALCLRATQIRQKLKLNFRLKRQQQQQR